MRYALTFALIAIPCSAAEREAALAKVIDGHIAKSLKAAPAPLCDDATFIRRVSLMLTGKIAAPEAVTAFLADKDAEKRTKLIDKLLDSKDYVEHFTAVWRGWLIPEAMTNPEVAGVAPGFEAWLREKLGKNVAYDKMVHELLTAPMQQRPAMARPVAEGEEAPPTPTNPLAFYTAKEAKPENLAAASSRLFLGIQLECAQCHDHPTSKWSRDQFWGTAAFFGGIERNGGALREVFDRREMAIPGTPRTVLATFLDDKEPEWRYKQSSRLTYAEWVVAKENPFFAKAGVNRLWGYLFGVGIVDPVDNFDDKNPASHPELLKELSEAFVASGFDLKYILRSICLSETFQRSSVGNGDVRTFARFPVQGMSPEQLMASLQMVIGPKPARPAIDRRLPVDLYQPRGAFFETFAVSGKKTESQTTILQALALMNGGEVNQATLLQSSKTLRDVLFANKDNRVERMYLYVLNRLPRPEEVARIEKHVTDVDGYVDVLWALLNSLEFRTIH